MKRRQFIRFGAAVGALSIVKPSQATNIVAQSYQGKAKGPIVLSTWNHGLAANEGAWAVLQKGGSALDAVEKGVIEALTTGVLAGYPVVDVKVTLHFGSYHDVDSNEMAFKMAAIFGFKEGCRKAQPVILEPMMAVEVETPEDYAGNVMGDLSSRRGMVQGMDDMVGGGKAIKAEVPLSEMFGYSTTLRSMSQGRATYTMEFKHYAEAPRNVAEAIVASRAK